MVDSWPNLPKTAEKEFIRRAQIAGEELGINIHKCTTSSEIDCIRPDLVIPCHEFTAKLSRHITLGAMWSPPQFFEEDKIRERSILSYDGYLPGSPHVSRFINDLFSQIRTGVKPIADFLFLPTSQDINNPRSAGEKRKLIYSGVHWDGLRHGELFYFLAQREAISLFGPQESWFYVGDAYKGEIPFDGNSMLTTIANHGISLCIHKESHVKADTPSMRLFEALAAGSLVITDEIEFAFREFGDTLFYLDPEMSAREKADFITEKIEWARENPLLADKMANDAKAIFSKKWSLQVLLPKVVDFAHSIASSPPYPLASQHKHACKTRRRDSDPSVDVIIRAGSRPLTYLRRAIDSVAAQVGVKVRVILVAYGMEEAIRKDYSSASDLIKIVSSPATGFRSTALWDGLKVVEASYFCVLDDDDTIECDHLARLIYALEWHSLSDKKLAYSGVVRIEEDGEYIDAINFGGPEKTRVTIQEVKELKFMDIYNPERLLLFDNYIQSNAWVASSELLKTIDLSDPCLEVAEDMYLYINFLSCTDFMFVPIQTANWHWRSKTSGNSMLNVSQEDWMRSHKVLMRRLKNLIFKSGISFSCLRQIASQGVASNQTPPDPDITTILPLSIMSDVIGNGFDRNRRQEGFHPIEASGVWTSSEFAWVQVYSESDCNCLRYDIEMMASALRANDGIENRNPTKILINGNPVYQGEPKPWSPIIAAGELQLDKATNTIILTIISHSLYADTSSNRLLGAFLRRIKIMPISSQKRIKHAQKAHNDIVGGLPPSIYISRALADKAQGKTSSMIKNTNIFLAEMAASGEELSKNQKLIVDRLLGA